MSWLRSFQNTDSRKLILLLIELVCRLVNSAEPSSTQALREPDVSFSVGLLSNTASKEPITAHTSSSSSPHTVQHDDTETSTPSQCCLWSSPGSSILVRRPCGWYFVFYIRMDPGGCFHMYPDVGCGPYQSLSEVDDAINQHLHDLWIPEMWGFLTLFYLVICLFVANSCGWILGCIYLGQTVTAFYISVHVSSHGASGWFRIIVIIRTHIYTPKSVKLIWQQKTFESLNQNIIVFEKKIRI